MNKYAQIYIEEFNKQAAFMPAVKGLAQSAMSRIKNFGKAPQVAQALAGMDEAAGGVGQAAKGIGERLAVGKDSLSDLISRNPLKSVGIAGLVGTGVGATGNQMMQPPEPTIWDLVLKKIKSLGKDIGIG